MKRFVTLIIVALLFIMSMFAWKIPENMRKHVPNSMTGNIRTYVDDNGEPVTYYDMNSISEKWNKLQTDGLAFINEESLRNSEPYWYNDSANYDFNKLAKFGLQLYWSKGIALDYNGIEVPYFVMYVYSLRTNSVVQIFTLSDSFNSAFEVWSDLLTTDVIFQ